MVACVVTSIQHGTARSYSCVTVLGSPSSLPICHFFVSESIHRKYVPVE